MSILTMIVASSTRSNDLSCAIVTPLVSICLSGLVSYLVAAYTLRSNRRAELDKRIAKIIEIAMQYPLVEDDEFCDSYPPDQMNDDYRRYVNYCCFVFNLLADAWKHTEGDVIEFNDIIHADELIDRHHGWWLKDSDNLIAYDKIFQQYISERILFLRKARQCRQDARS